MLLHSNIVIFKHFIVHKVWQYCICNDMLNRQNLIDVAKRVHYYYYYIITSDCNILEGLLKER